MLRFKYIDFTQDIINRVVSENTTADTAFIFVSKKNLNIARKMLNNSHSLEGKKLTTIDELTSLLWSTDAPQLSDEHRYLLFYQSLDTKYKEKYGFDDYFSSLGFAKYFFDLFTECIHECIDFAHISDTLTASGNFLDWQRDIWDDMLGMYADYLHYIKNALIKQSDIITAEIHFDKIDSEFATYDHIIIVNQFYFTNAEKKIIHRLCENKTVTLYFQLPEALFDQKSLSVTDFSLHSLISTGVNVKKIHLYGATNDFVQMTAMLQNIKAHQIKHIICSDDANSSWQMFLPSSFSDTINNTQTIPITHTAIYQFLHHLHAILSAIHYVPQVKKQLIPLVNIFSAFSNHAFRKYFLPDSTESDLDAFFARLSRRNTLYIDPYNFSSVFSKDDHESIVTGMTAFIALLTAMLPLKQMSQLLDLFDNHSGICLDKISDTPATVNTDLHERLADRLSSLRDIDAKGVVADWKHIISASPAHPPIVPLLKYLLGYIRPINAVVHSSEKNQVEFLDLLDTRNLHIEKPLFLNVSEGVLPKAKSFDFLFNEHQREIIGLKTYNEIRTREKYYFFRTILCASQSHIIYIQDEDQNIDKSSFIEEILLNLLDIVSQTSWPDSGYIDFYSTENTSNTTPTAQKSENKDSFPAISADFQTDFTPQNTIRLNTYSLLNLLDEPMRWFINDYLSIGGAYTPAEPTLNELTIGLFAHKMIETIVYKLKKQDNVTLGEFKNCLNDDYLFSIFHELAYGYYLTAFPHDFTSDYFRDVLLPFAIARLQSFFCNGELSAVSDDSTIESELAPPEKLLLDTQDYKVYIAGRVDMLIHDPQSDIYYIIDFKTGHSDPIQLVIYDWLLSDSHKNHVLYFTNLFDTDETISTNSTKINIDTICEKLRSVLDKCKTDGYFAVKNSKYSYGFDKISRN